MQEESSIFNGLRKKEYGYCKNEELATLGVLAMLPVDIDSLINDVIQVDNYLSTISLIVAQQA